jgi:serine/threonine-protein phosphatase CPPED1
MPFFYVAGNHDLSNVVMEKEWKERFGRRWYHFVYHNVLFLMLNSDDPAKGGGTVGKEQLAYIARVLAENPNARWTVVAMHKPLWDQTNLPTNGWLEVEKVLTGRPYTVFVGHEHEYRKFVRHGQNYYQLATTGGISRMRGLRYGEFDHIVWVTMKKSGPVLANLMLDGIFPEDMRRVAGAEEPEHTYFDRKRPHPARGKVYLDGAPVADAEVAFHLLVTDPKTKKTTPRRTADALTDADGSFLLSTYSAFDGAPPGEYQMTVVQRQPRFDAAGRPGQNLLPGRYAAPGTSGLKGEVRTGQNEFIFNLTR